MLKHLICLSPTLFVTHAAWYGKNKAFNRNHIPSILKDVREIEDELQLTAHRFIMRALRAKNLNGLTFPATSLSYVDPRRRTYDELLFTFLHESLHLKQVQDGDLRWDDKHSSLVWKGKHYSNERELNELSIEKYNLLPWEIDVATKQSSIFTKIFNREPPRLHCKNVGLIQSNE